MSTDKDNVTVLPIDPQLARQLIASESQRKLTCCWAGCARAGPTFAQLSGYRKMPDVKVEISTKIVLLADYRKKREEQKDPITAFLDWAAAREPLDVMAYRLGQRKEPAFAVMRTARHEGEPSGVEVPIRMYPTAQYVKRRGAFCARFMLALVLVLLKRAIDPQAIRADLLVVQRRFGRIGVDMRTTRGQDDLLRADVHALSQTLAEVEGARSVFAITQRCIVRPIISRSLAMALAVIAIATSVRPYAVI